ncbi:MAG TPA: hypothetical protein VGS19_21630 [Streptosporangiaceae bacterium]|nr:hypothetical protein [Streptosporangiaceae bacterium]
MDSGGAPQWATDGWPAADLTAIRRTDLAIDLVAKRRLRTARALGDVEISLLSSLAADVDSPPATAVTRRSTHVARTWVDTAAAVLVVSLFVLLAAGLVAADMLARLGVGAAPGRSRRPGRPHR